MAETISGNSHSPHLAPESRLPPDLEREIFEICGLSRPVTIPKLMLVAWRVKDWVEPLLYRLVCMTDKPPIASLGLPQFTSGILLRVLNEKPAGFLSRTLRYLYLWNAPHADMSVILSACTGVTRLFIAPQEPEICAALGDMPHLRRLALAVGDLFQHHPERFAHRIFRNITHLEIFDERNADASILAELSLVPYLTHFSFWAELFLDSAAGAILASCPRLQYLVFCASSRVLNPSVVPACERLASDPRFIVVVVSNFECDWMRGALVGEDYWARAEAFVAAKQIGQVGSSVYQVTDDDSWSAVL
ncbi:hypothetical protein FB451DRAFT_1293313 [Mycena latifolia]|nr:hypothetical protein FB451DRAFT_1293313 [Mycena latifolia]